MQFRARILLSGALASVIVSCGALKEEHHRTEITLWKHQTGADEEAANFAAINRFNASQNKWHIAAQSLPQGAYGQSIVAASLAGQMPCILTVDSPKVASFVWAGHLRPIDDLMPASDFAHISSAALGRYQGHIYSVGQFDAALALFTRRSILAHIGARIPTLDKPWTRAEFDDVLAKLKASHSYSYPLDLQTRDTKADWWTYAFSPMLQSFGGDLIDRSTMQSANGTLNGADAQHFGAWFQSLFKNGLVNRREPDENAFVTGRAAMAYTGNWWAPAYRKAFGGDLLILPPPDFGHGAVIGGGSWQWAVSTTCAHPEAAGAFIRFVMGPKELAAISDAAGGVPVTDAGAMLSTKFRQGGEGRIFFDLMHRFARGRPATPAFTVISSAYYTSMRNIMDGKDVHDALDDAADEIDQTIADNHNYSPQKASGQGR